MLHIDLVDKINELLSGYDVLVGTLVITNTPGIVVNVNEEIYIAYAVDESQIFIGNNYNDVLIGMCNIVEFSIFVKDFMNTYGDNIDVK
jgi:hypothetical protein